MRETVTNTLGDTIAVLDWNGATANIDYGTITRQDDGTVLVRLQNTRTGRIRQYTATTTVDAFHQLGLTAHQRNGIDGWFGMTTMPGTAGRD